MTTPGNVLLARIYDAITALSYGLAGIEDAPESLANKFMADNLANTNEKQLKGFDSGKEFDEYRKELIRKIEAKKAAKK